MGRAAENVLSASVRLTESADRVETRFDDLVKMPSQLKSLADDFGQFAKLSKLGAAAPSIVAATESNNFDTDKAFIRGTVGSIGTMYALSKSAHSKKPFSFGDIDGIGAEIYKSGIAMGLRISGLIAAEHSAGTFNVTDMGPFNPDVVESWVAAGLNDAGKDTVAKDKAAIDKFFAA